MHIAGVQNVKAKALKNAVWKTTQRKCECPAAEEPAKRAPAKKKNHTSSTGHGMVGITAGSRAPGISVSPKNVKEIKHPNDEPEDASDFQLSGDEVDAGTDADLKPIEDESDDCIVKLLSAESPQIPTFVSKAEQLDFPLTQPTWPCVTMAASKLSRTVEPFPFSSAQPNLRAPTRCPLRSQNLSLHTPIWADDSPSEEDHHGGLTSDEHCNSSKGNLVDHDAQADHIHNHDHTTGGPKLVWTDTGKIKPMDQDLDTCRVVQRAILEPKVHLTSVNGYPKLTKKGLFTWDALVTASRACGVPPIQNRLKTDDSYGMAPATLDDACAHITAYYRLGPDCVDAAKKLLVNHVYHYAQHFDDKNVAIPQANKPNSADILPYLMKGYYFNGPKSVGVNFSDRFKEITSNKAQRPKVTIPMVASTTTSVYAALFWKSSGSPSKFNFTGNLFSKVYLFHAKFLEKLRQDAPGKFRRLMADIFEAICKLFTNGNSDVGSHNDAMAILDLASMDDDSE
ncbi:hypothetical protein C8R48DRAFT_780583 [Suillus tomentosus]|nr:hypothetical protein C8R48DRAFT_780583 [Suillus tomentosus]